MTNQEHFKTAIRIARASKKNSTIKEVAKEIGISELTLSKAEKTGVVNSTVMFQILDFYNLKLTIK